MTTKKAEYDVWTNQRHDGIQKFYDKRLYHDLHHLKLANGEPPDSALRVKSREDLERILDRVIGGKSK